MKPYRVGIIGFGFIGKAHAYGYLTLPLFYDPVPLEARITHVCTGRRETAEKGAALVGAAHAVTDYRAVTEDPDVDIVHICTPNHLHKDELVSAMKHGKHIYCEKPLVATMDEAREIEAALKDYRGTAQIVFHNRFFPATMRARQMIEAGFLGKVLEYRAAYLHAGSASAKTPLKWKLSGAAGGGVITDLASHVFDLVHLLLGDYDRLMAATCIAYAERPSPDDTSRRVPVDAEDCVMVLARHRSGAMGMIEATKLAQGSEDELRLEIHGSDGALRFNGMDPHHLEVYDATAAEKPIGGTRGWTRLDTGQRYPPPASGFPTPKATIGWLRGHVACLANFLQAVAEGKPGDPGLQQGLYIQHVMECAKESARTEKWVRV
ncbi:MAG TPA: Gfo/Idh/MocA family oxidoreductase [Phycisphaerae bacterium]|nr:Gfo/Idh/MocA family oxidoreductase [Phycisphaerae bacterium]